MRKTLALFVFLAASAFLFSSQAPADSPSLLSRFEKNYRSARSLQATFLEEYFENGKQTRANSGTAYFSKPGRMRWEYQRPEKSMFLVDGKSAWFYVPADRTVTRLPMQGSGDWRTPFAFLAGDLKLSRLCAKIAPLVPGLTTGEGESSFECVLPGQKTDSGKRSGEVERVFFALTAAGELTLIRIEAPGGVRMDFRFRNWEFNPNLAESMFHVDVPPGVTIVDGVLPSGGLARQ